MSVVSPKPKRWTVEECNRLQETGILEARYELIDGEIYDKMGQKPAHALFLLSLMIALEELFGRRRVRGQSPITLPNPFGQYSEPEPDVVVTKEDGFAYIQHPLPEDIVLLAEVSDTTYHFDVVTKALLYARAGISEYWVIDVENRKLIVHQSPTKTGYQTTTAYDEEAQFSLLALPAKQITVNWLFPPPQTEATPESNA